MLDLFDCIVVDRFHFLGLHNRPSCCRLHVFQERPERPCSVVVVTELDDNPGTSVTNAAEHLATVVCDLYTLDPERLRWIEHYPRRKGCKSEFDWVVFKRQYIGFPTTHPVVFDDPTWYPMTDAHWGACGVSPTDIVDLPPTPKED